jgi:hypothetical protein
MWAPLSVTARFRCDNCFFFLHGRKLIEQVNTLKQSGYNLSVLSIYKITFNLEEEEKKKKKK